MCFSVEFILIIISLKKRPNGIELPKLLINQYGIVSALFCIGPKGNRKKDRGFIWINKGKAIWYSFGKACAFILARSFPFPFTILSKKS